MENIVGKHISLVEKRLKKYSSLILKSKYDAGIGDELIGYYIDARYYNYNIDENINVFYKRVYESVKERTEKAIKKQKEDKEKYENMLFIIQYLFYFDNVRNNVPVVNVVGKIAEKRTNQFNLRIKENDDFEKKMLMLITRDLADVDAMFNAYQSKDFYLTYNKANKESNIYNVKLNYTFEMPRIFNKEVVEETFNTDIIAEDKLFVLFPMIALKALEDVYNSGNFKKGYLVDFPVSLFEKKKKMNQLLEIINNQLVLDKVSLKVNYKDYLENKKDIHDLIKKGFSFSLVTDKNMPKLTDEEIKLLNIFNCILVDKEDINKKKYKRLNTIEM